MSAIPTSASQHYEELVAQGIVNRCTHPQSETELLDIPALLESDRSPWRVISPFPLHSLYEVYGLKYVDDAPVMQRHVSRPTVFFAKSELFTRCNALHSLKRCIRDVWLELLENGPLLDSALDLVMFDRMYLKTLARMAGVKFLIQNAETLQPNWVTCAANSVAERAPSECAIDTNHNSLLVQTT
jgi:hypothetical protein